MSAMPAPETYLRLTVSDQEMSLQERLGGVMQTLVRQPVKKSGDQAFTLRLRSKATVPGSGLIILP